MQQSFQTNIEKKKNRLPESTEKKGNTKKIFLETEEIKKKMLNIWYDWDSLTFD